MPSIWNDKARLALVARFEKLASGATPKWGQFTAGKMVQHCADGIRMAAGQLSVQPKEGGAFRLPVVKQLIIYVLPWPKGVPTAPELIPAHDPNLTGAIASLKSELFRLVSQDPARPLAEHPAFGKLSRRTWGVLIHRHLDHHLKQFGV